MKTLFCTRRRLAAFPAQAALALFIAVAAHGCAGPDNVELVQVHKVYCETATASGTEFDLCMGTGIEMVSRAEKELLPLFGLCKSEQSSKSGFGECVDRKAASVLPETAFSLALLFSQDEIFEQDIAKTIHWFTQAARGGITEAKVALASIFAHEEGYKNCSKKIYWLESAVAEGNQDAMIALAREYQRGDCGLVVDFQKAYDLMIVPAKKGNARAQLSIGYMHLEGLGVDRNEKVAMEWIALVEKSDNKRALKALQKIKEIKGW